MIDAIWNGISGLNVYQKALNSESNNVTNTNTIAYKSDRVTFSDLMYQNGYGLGTQINAPTKDFSEGNITVTNNAYDMAIMGDGFFTVINQAGDTFYTRGGNFKMSNDGYLRTELGDLVQGVSIDEPAVVTSNSAVTKFNDNYTKLMGSQAIDNSVALQSINAKSTNYEATSIDSGVSGNNYKIAGAKIHDVEELTKAYKDALITYSTDLTGAGVPSMAQITNVTFPPSSITKEGDVLTIYVDSIKYKQNFDTDAATTLNKLSDQISTIPGLTSLVDTTTGELNITSLIPGLSVSIGSAKINDDIMIATNVQEASKGTGKAAYTSVRDALKTAIENAGAEFLEITDSVNLTNAQNLSFTSLQLRPDLLNISDNAFGTVDVVDGSIYRTQGENRFLLGKVVTSVFNDNLGLNPVGGNLYTKTDESGDPYYSNGANTIQSKAVEVSNSDLSKSLTNLMIYQRSFEANSKTVTTSDEFLKTAIQLKS